MGKGQWRLIPGVFGVLCCAAVVVCALSETSVINEFAAGIVDIEIRDSGTGEKQRILPGQKLGGPYRIQNNGSDCFVRARFTLRGLRARVGDCITGMDDMWMEGDDGYYYCREVLKEGAFVNLIDGMKIPETLSQAPEGGSLQLDVEVEAVQSKNFRPDFHAVSPWGEVQILQNEKTGSLQSFTPAEDRSFLIEYKGSSRSMFASEKDFFANFPILMPGDEYRDSAVINNDSGGEVKLYFRSEGTDGLPLPEGIQLEISAEQNGIEQLIYTGCAGGKELAENRLLLTLPEHSEGKLKFQVSVPEKLGNEFSLLSGHVKWVFSTDPAEGMGGEAVKTGDEQEAGLYLTGLGFCLMAALIFKRLHDLLNCRGS